MAEVVLSVGERNFLKNGIQENFRVDGRSFEDYRHMELEIDMVSSAAGSARLRLATTDVLVGVKVELGAPNVSRPDEGRLEFFVDCSANASPQFEGRGGDELAASISSMLARAYGHASCVDLKKLCVIPKLKVWVLYIDILVLQCGGNLFDVVSIAVKAALYNTRIPVVSVVQSENDVPDIEVSDDPYDVSKIDVHNVPIIVTVSKVDKCHIVDASVEEETCVSARLMVGVTENGMITALRKEGGGSLIPSSVSKMIDTAYNVGQLLNKSLMLALKKEEKLDKPADLTGFLR